MRSGGSRKLPWASGQRQRAPPGAALHLHHAAADTSRMPPCPHASAPLGRLAAALCVALLCLGCGAARGAPVEAADAAEPAEPRDRAPVSAALARATFDSAWRTIGATYYDAAMGGRDWGAVRDTLGPRADRARTLRELRAVLRALAGATGESHFGLLARDDTAGVAAGGAPAGRRAGYTGLVLRALDGGLVVAAVEPDSPAASAGVRAGWWLEAVDGVAVAAEASRRSRPGPAALRRVLRVQARVDGAAGTVARLAFRDADGRAAAALVARTPPPGRTARYGSLGEVSARLVHERATLVGGGCALVVRFDRWLPVLLPDLEAAMAEAARCRGVVLDLRGNTGGVAGMSMAVAGHFVDSATVLGVLRVRAGHYRYVAEPRRAAADGRPAAPFPGPLAVLVDGHAASTSEFLAAGLQEAGRARLFGERTAGQALPALLLPLPTGDLLLHVVADFTTPAGRRVEGRGASPDEPVPLRRADLLAGRDAPRAAALAWIAAQRGRRAPDPVAAVPAGEPAGPRR